MLVNTTEELTENEVDAIVDMDMNERLKEVVRRAVDDVVRVVGMKWGTEEKIRDLVPDVVKGYEPAVMSPQRTRLVLPEEAVESLKKGRRVTKRPNVTGVYSKLLRQELVGRLCKS